MAVTPLGALGALVAVQVQAERSPTCRVEARVVADVERMENRRHDIDCWRPRAGRRWAVASADRRDRHRHSDPDPLRHPRQVADSGRLPSQPGH